MTLLTKPTRLLLLALFLGWVANLLFFDAWLGASVPLYIALVVWGLYFSLKQQRQKMLWQNRWLLAPLLFFSVMVMVRDSSLLTFLNLSAIVYLLFLVATFATADDATRPGFIEFSMIPWRVGWGTLSRPYPLVRETVDFDQLHQRGQHTFYPVLRGAVLATPIFLVFLALLLSADAVFATAVERLLDRNITLQFPARMIFIVVVSWLAAGWLSYAVRRDTAVSSPIPLRILEVINRRFFLGPTESAIILLSLNLLFCSFVAVQFAYLFGGLQQIAFNGLTYAEYARRGFFELVTVSVLTLGLILVLHYFTRRPSKRSEFVFNLLSSVMVGFVVVMLISAFKRLTLYELQYGFTETRIYVHVFMIWLAALLVWFGLALWIQPKRLAIGALIAGMGFLVTLNIMNPDAFVVRQNLARFDLVGYLDVDYLTTLSNDAVPALIEVQQAIESLDEVVHADNCSFGYSDRISTEIVDSESMIRGTNNLCFETRDPNYLSQHLNGRLTSMLTSEEMWHWQSWQYGRMNAYRALLDWSAEHQVAD